MLWVVRAVGGNLVKGCGVSRGVGDHSLPVWVVCNNNSNDNYFALSYPHPLRSLWGKYRRDHKSP